MRRLKVGDPRGQGFPLANRTPLPAYPNDSAPRSASVDAALPTSPSNVDLPERFHARSTLTRRPPPTHGTVHPPMPPPADPPRSRAKPSAEGECPREEKSKGDFLQRLLPSPDRPLLRLLGREIYAEDVLLILLILTLKEEKADPALLVALVYLLFC